MVFCCTISSRLAYSIIPAVNGILYIGASPRCHQYCSLLFFTINISEVLIMSAQNFLPYRKTHLF